MVKQVFTYAEAAKYCQVSKGMHTMFSDQTFPTFSRIFSFVVQCLNYWNMVAWLQILCIQLKRVSMNAFGELVKLQVLESLHWIYLSFCLPLPKGKEKFPGRNANLIVFLFMT